MELTKQHKALLAVLGLGATAIVCDRVFFSGGVTGPASVQASTLREVGAKPDAAEATPTSNMIAERLAAAAAKLDGDAVQPDALNDVFGEPVAVKQTMGLDVRDEMERAKPAPKYEHLKVGLVMLNPRPMASINGVRLEVDGEARIGEGAQRHSVKLLSVKGPDRKTGELGSVVVLVDGVDRIELVIER